MNLHTIIHPIQEAVAALKSAETPEARQEAKDQLAAALSRPGPLRVTITHEPFMPWFKLEYNGQTEELDHEQCLEWFRLRGAKDMDKVNDAINQAFNFGRGTRGMVYSEDRSVAVHEDRPGVVVVIGEPKTPPLPPGQEARYLPNI